MLLSAPASSSACLATLPACLSASLSALPVSLPIQCSAGLIACLFICLPAYWFAYLPSSLADALPAMLTICAPAGQHACTPAACLFVLNAKLVYLYRAAPYSLDVLGSSAGMQALKALMRREATLVQRNSFLYIFKAVQVSDAYVAGTCRRNIVHE